MSSETRPDWDLRADEVLRDQRAAFDEMRERCPVAYSELLQWSLFRHEDVTRVLRNPNDFSNAVSQHVSVPNGMDPPEHTHFRQVIEPYFAPSRIAAFEPVCRKIASDLIRRAVADGKFEAMEAIAYPYAARAQCAFLGWPPELDEHLIGWTKRNFAATREQNRQAISEIAGEFKIFIHDILASRIANPSTAPLDVTAALMSEMVLEQPLTRDQLASILRNWTVGEVGTISAAVGILLQFLSEQPQVVQLLRDRPESLRPAVDEILRLHGPLVSNRRVVKRPVEIGGRKLEAGARITLIWVAANRDGRVFEDPHEFRLDRDPAKNLLFGEGIHACPAAPLARMMLQVVVDETLRQASDIKPASGATAVNAKYPASGFEKLPLAFQAASASD